MRQNSPSLSLNMLFSSPVKAFSLWKVRKGEDEGKPQSLPFNCHYEIKALAYPEQ